MGNLHSSYKEADLVKCLDVRRETTMDAEDFTLDYCSNTEVVENFAAVFPRVCISVLANSLVIESVHRCDLPRLMIATKKRDVARVLHLETEQQLERLDRVVTTINEVAHEYVLRIRNLSSFLKKFEQVMELTVDVAANRDRGTHRLHVAFFDQDFLDFLTKDAEIAFR